MDLHTKTADFIIHNPDMRYKRRLETVASLCQFEYTWPADGRYDGLPKFQAAMTGFGVSMHNLAEWTVRWNEPHTDFEHELYRLAQKS